MPDEPRAEGKTLAIPGFWRLGWLIFMQPARLHRLCREEDRERAPHWRIWRDTCARQLVAHMAPWLVLVVPVMTVLVATTWYLLDVPVVLWPVVRGAAISAGVAVAVAGISVLQARSAIDAVRSVVAGIGLGLIVGALLVYWGVEEVWFVDLGDFLIVCMTMGAVIAGATSVIVYGDHGPSKRNAAAYIAVGILMLLWFALPGNAAGSVTGILAAVAYVTAFTVSYARVPIYLVESVWMAALRLLLGPTALSARRAAELLPFRHDDLIFLPLPWLRTVLVEIGKRDPELARELIAEAAESIGQKRAARLALAELQAGSLEQAARRRDYDNAAALTLAYIPTEISTERTSTVLALQQAAKELVAARMSQSHDHRKRVLDRAEKILREARLELAAARPAEPLRPHSAPVIDEWLVAVADEKARLEQAMREHPQVPTPFVVGPAIGPDDQALFKGRQDLVRLIDHDLAGDRRALIVLLGQRRMGKSSLLRMLPIQLGTGTIVVTVNFQGLSGSPHRSQPHRWIAEEVARALGQRNQRSSPAGPALVTTDPPAEAAWGVTLDWLRGVDAALAARDERVLVAIDEVERLQDGIEAGWANTDLLDLARAAADHLAAIRMLLVSAHPLTRLGPAWVDRLISVIQHEISYLEPDAAEDLIRHPSDDFPAIYPDGGVDRILAETRCHPYLIQLVCDELCRHLNGQERLVATLDDIDAAIDHAFSKTNLFTELWRHLDDDEHAWLQTLATAPRAVDRPDPALRRLVREHYVEERAGQMHIAVPMFATWIADEQAGQN